MKAFTLSEYGPPSEVLKLQEVPKPSPQKNQVLVKIKATAINDYDWSMVTGTPGINRLLFGLRRPKHQIPGMELAGVVEGVGPNVKSFAVGDAVYGDISNHGFGTFAEYICIHEKALVQKPEAISFEQATSISHASMLAYQGLIDIGKIQHSHNVLINGGGGGVGTFGLQLAKLYDAKVTGVDSGEKLKTMKELGFDEVIDYREHDFTKNGLQYELILDCKSSRKPSAYLPSLRPGGSYVTIGGQTKRLIQTLLLRPWFSSIYKKQVRIVALKPNKDLAHLHELIKEEKIKCVIDGPYQFEEIPRLVKYFGEGKHTGKVVIRVSG